MTSRSRKSNPFAKHLSSLGGKVGTKSLETFLDVASGGGSAKAAPATAHRHTDWHSRPSAPAPTGKKRRSR